jgi:acyl-coenzyme A synthetase/AMP-(fatty) acid ligase
MNLIEPIIRHARTRSHDIALIEHDQTITYGALAQEVLRTEGYLASLGVKQGDQVGICLADDWRHITIFLAATHMGAVAVQIDWRSRPAEKIQIVRAFDLKFIVEAKKSDTGARCTSILVDEGWQQRVARVDHASQSVQDWHAPMTALGSSGTTGIPKFTLATHLEYYFHVASYLEVVPRIRHHVFLSTLPLYFSAGRLSVLSHLLRGDTLVLYPALFTADELLEIITRRKVTASFVVPSILRQLLAAADGSRLLLPDLKLLVATGAPLFAEEKILALGSLTPGFHELYGAAALGPLSMLQPQDVRERPGSVGLPLPLIDIDIVDDDNRSVPPGQTGRLRCRGPGLTSPIVLSGGQPPSDFLDGWHYPGELAAVDDSGFIHLCGRESEIIFRGGAKIFPAEIEAVLQAHASVAEVAVVGRTLANNEQEVVAYVVVRGQIEAGELMAHCRTHLAGFKVPRHIQIMIELPRNASGKVDKRALTNAVIGQHSGAA